MNKEYFLYILSIMTISVAILAGLFLIKQHTSSNIKRVDVRVFQSLDSDDVMTRQYLRELAQSDLPIINNHVEIAYSPALNKFFTKADNATGQKQLSNFFIQHHIDHLLTQENMVAVTKQRSALRALLDAEDDFLKKNPQFSTSKTQDDDAPKIIIVEESLWSNIVSFLKREPRTLAQSAPTGAVLQSETTATQEVPGFMKIVPALIRAFSNTGLPEATETGETPVGGTPNTGGGSIPPTGSLPTSGVPIAQTVVVQGVRVHTSIASRIDAMVTDAKAAGINLSGGGWRDPTTQIRLRRQNCGTSNYEIYQKPAGQCRPPTARPGSSRHERGLAIDIRCDGTIIPQCPSKRGGRCVAPNNRCWVWLEANAANYGMKPLRSEAWHWSTDGH